MKADSPQQCSVMGQQAVGHKYRKFHLKTGHLVIYFTVRWLNSLPKEVTLPPSEILQTRPKMY